MRTIIIIGLTFICLILFSAQNAEASHSYKSVDFEVSGKVQKVYFRKHTQNEANKIGVVGWCRNTKRGTVEGTIQGSPEQIKDMQSRNEISR